MSNHTADQPVLDFDLACDALDQLVALTDEQKAVITAHSASLTDYLYWYRKALEFARTQPVELEWEGDLVAEFDLGDPYLIGSALATLVAPCIGLGVHLRQVQLLSAGLEVLNEQGNEDEFPLAA